jgi:hypothetical protein
MMPLRLALLIAAAAATAACGPGDDAAASASDIRTDSAGGLVVAPSTPYRPTDGDASTALVVTVAGDSAATPAGACTAGTPATSETVFWVDGIREGKPLPNERRYQLVNGDCGLEPRMQATVIGGAVNVFNDAGTHRLVFVRAGTTDTLQTMPFNMPGSIVATDRLTKIAGVVEVKCSQHPNEKAYIAVFDHPYFGVGSSGDKVTLEAIPAGDYRVMTWHEGMPAPTAMPAKVSTTGQTEIILR